MFRLNLEYFSHPNFLAIALIESEIFDIEVGAFFRLLHNYSLEPQLEQINIGKNEKKAPTLT